VEALHRSAFGGLTLAGLSEPGQWRWVGAEERTRALVSPASARPA
jgi:16S rRNA U516 pseudouridylate synthase RsuA-like enzyme